MAKGSNAPLGSGERFAALKKQLSNRKGVKDPDGLANFIERRNATAKVKAKKG